MKVHRRCTVFGSRLLFFALAPWLLVCIPLFPYMAFNFDRSRGTTLLAAAASLLCLLGLLVTIVSWRFLRLTVVFLSLVPVMYVAYFSCGRALTLLTFMRIIFNRLVRAADRGQNNIKSHLRWRDLQDFRSDAIAWKSSSGIACCKIDEFAPNSEVLFRMARSGRQRSIKC